MIDSLEKYLRFIEKNREEDLFIHIVNKDENKHPVLSEISLIFIKNIKNDETYIISIDHQDLFRAISLNTFVEDLLKFKGNIFVLDKKNFIQEIPYLNVESINLGLNLEGKPTFIDSEFDTNSHKFIYNNKNRFKYLNRAVPLVKHKEKFELVFKKVKPHLKSPIFKENYYKTINSIITETLSDIEINGIYVDIKKFKNSFDCNDYNLLCNKNYVYSQYNIFTSTGRPSNRFGGINFSALSKENGCRKSIISRFGKKGILISIDYSSFHPNIICEMMDFKIPDNQNFYSYIAKHCFNKEEVDDKDIVDVKKLVFTQLYGNIDEKYIHIKFFYELNKLINIYWEDFEVNGYVKTPIFGRKITGTKLEFESKNKLFNYVLQSVETEIVIPVINKINVLLKNKSSKVILYTYDSILLDVNKEELDFIKTDIVNVMMCNGTFPVKIYEGNNYDDMKTICR